MDFDWPFRVESIEWGIQKAGVQFTGPYNGTRQAVEFAAERWLVSINLPPRITAESGAVEALLERLAGGVNRVRIWHMARPVPLGTMRGTPTVAVQAVRGDLSLTLQTTGSSSGTSTLYSEHIGYAEHIPYDGVTGASDAATLKAGDMFAAGGQLFKTAEDCQADSAGVMVVPVTTRVRATIATGAAVTWDKPKALFCLPASSMRFAHTTAILNGVAVELEEVW